MKKTIKQHILMYLLAFWGFASLVICAGEDIPGKEMSNVLFFGSKIAGFISFWLCCLTWSRLSKKGLLPKI